MRRSGFTLVEFVVVVAIIVILGMFLSPVLGPHHEPNHRGMCQSNLKKIGLGFLQYVNDNGERFPPENQLHGVPWVELIQPYVNEAVFQCPTAPGTLANSTDYFYNGRLSRVKDEKINDSSQTVMAGDGQDDSSRPQTIQGLPKAWIQTEISPARRHLDGASYLFVDGHVKWMVPLHMERSTVKGAKYTFAIQ